MISMAAVARELMAAGLSGPDLVAALERIESSGHSTGIPVDTAAERRRAWDRERKAQKRNSTGHSTGIPPDTKSATSLSSGTEVHKKEPKKERSRGARIPPDWKPNVGHIAAGKQLGFSESQIYEQAEDMRLWAHANEHRAVARKSDWDMTFLVWLRRNKPKGQVNGHESSLVETKNRLVARAKELESEAGFGDVEPETFPGFGGCGPSG